MQRTLNRRMIPEYSYTHRSYKVEIFCNGRVYYPLVFILPKSSNWETLILKGCSFSCLEEAIEAADEWIDEICVNHN